MKKGKLLILLVAILSLAVIFAACDQSDADGENDSSVQTGDVTDNAPEEIVETDVSNEQKYADHEMHDYFDLSVEEDADPLALTSRFEGDIAAYDLEHGLLAVRTKTVDALEIEKTVIKVYDLATGEVIREDSVSSPYGNKPIKDAVTIEVDIDYPVIRIAKTRYATADDGEDPEPQKDIAYYIAEKDGELIHATSDGTYREYREYSNGLVCYLMGDKYVWIDRDLNVLRLMDRIAAEYNYLIDPENVIGEYKGYIYTCNRTSLMVFNHSGMVSAQYTVADKDTYIAGFILDDGNVLLQEFVNVGAYGECDFVLSGSRYVMKSMIVNAVDGSVKDIELDSVMYAIETEYEQEGFDRPALKLANGMDNLAVVYKVVNGSISAYASLCVMDNNGTILYTVKNDTFGVDLRGGIEYIGRERYVADMSTNGSNWKAIFDLDGNFISAYEEYAFYQTDKYLVSDNAIYSYDMKLIYNFIEGGYLQAHVIGNEIYLIKINYETGKIEMYSYLGSGKTKLVTSDFESEYKALEYIAEDYYITYDKETDAYTVYNSEGEELLVSHYNVFPMAAGNGITLLVTQFNDEFIVYVLQ